MSERHGREIGQYDEPPEWFKKAQNRSSSEKFLDGCHRYGWLINLLLTALMFAYFIGTTSERLADVDSRLARVERQIDSLLHITRGLSEDGVK